jgi:hypothetical protein
MNYKRKYNKVKGGNYHEYFNDHHSNRSVAFSVRRGRRLLLEKTTVGVVSHILTIYPLPVWDGLGAIAIGGGFLFYAAKNK